MRVALDRIALLASADLTSAEVALRSIPNDDPGETFVSVVMQKLRNGTARLCDIREDGIHIGWTVYELEQIGEHREFVSVATKTDKTANRAEVLGIALERLALSLGCRSMRMHTVRHGLVLKSLKNGWHTAEIVLRKNLT